jgi:hypothetical protein
LEDDEAEPIEAQPGLPDEAAYYRKGANTRKAAGAVEMTKEQVPMTKLVAAAFPLVRAAHFPLRLSASASLRSIEKTQRREGAERR